VWEPLTAHDCHRTATEHVTEMVFDSRRTCAVAYVNDLMARPTLRKVTQLSVLTAHKMLPLDLDWSFH
jgi:hypothetical protein